MRFAVTGAVASFASIEPVPLHRVPGLQRPSMEQGARRCTARPGLVAYFSFAALRSSSALSVFSQEKAVALCFLPAPSV